MMEGRCHFQPTWGNLAADGFRWNTRLDTYTDPRVCPVRVACACAHITLDSIHSYTPILSADQSSN